MGGIGPAPAENRRRTNEPGRGEWRTLEPLSEPVLPVLPDLGLDGESWPEITVLAWEAWREDPVTQLYGPADISFALDTIRLHAAMTPTSAKEVRLRMTGLGLTPEGKIKLRVRLDEPGDGEPAEKAKGKSKSSKRSGRRARLTVVPDE